jgi:Ni/Fe-hydrogenase subunit HybB-like protein
VKSALAADVRWPLPVRWALGLIAVVGVVFIGIRFAYGLGSVANINNAYPWGWWAGSFMWLIAFGGAGFTLALLAEVFALHRFEPFVRPSILIGLLCYVSYAVILVIELGRPWNGWVVFTTWQHESPLFEIAICASLYMTCLLIEFGVIAAGHAGWRRAARILGAIYLPVVVLGVSLSHLHQSTLGTALNIIPLKIDPRWWSEMLPFQFLVSAYAAGLAVVMAEHVLAARFARSPLRPKALGDLGAILAWVLGVYLALRMGVMLATGNVPSMFRFDTLTLSLWIEVVLGAIVPFVLLLLPEARRSVNTLLVAALLVAGGVILHRLNITVFAMTVKSWETYTPAFGELITTFGVIALMLLVYRRILMLLPIHEEPTVAVAAPAIREPA